MRKSVYGLAFIAQLRFLLDSFSESIFVFTNIGKDKLKILFWNHNGFWLYYRRLETGRFGWPASESGKALKNVDFISNTGTSRLKVNSIFMHKMMRFYV